MKLQITTNMLRALMWLAIVPLLVGCEQSRVDALMEELCQKDGGIKIYERVILPKHLFNQYGTPLVFKGWDRLNEGYQFTWDTERIKKDKPTLTRYVYSVKRNEDKKLLGEYVVYMRIGGDLIWRPGPDSSKSCPTKANEIVFLKTIFIEE